MIISVCAYLLATSVSPRWPLPGAEKILYVRDGDLYIKTRQNPAERLLLHKVEKASFSPKQGKICFIQEGHLRVYDVNTRKLGPTDVKVSKPWGPPSWHPTLPVVVFDSAKRFRISGGSGNDSTVWVNSARVIDIRDADIHPDELLFNGDLKRVHQALPSSVGGVSWSPDGRTIAFCTEGDTWTAEYADPVVDPNIWRWDGSRLCSNGYIYINAGAESEGWEAEETKWSADGKWICTMMATNRENDDFCVVSDKNGKEIGRVGGTHPIFWGKSLIVTRPGKDGCDAYDLVNKKERKLGLSCDFVVAVVSGTKK